MALAVRATASTSVTAGAGEVCLTVTVYPTYAGVVAGGATQSCVTLLACAFDCTLLKVMATSPSACQGRAARAC